VNWWMLAGGLSALVCTVGHALAGVRTFYRPIKAAIVNNLQAGLFTGMWHLITINFALSAIALLVLGVHGPAREVGRLVAAQFAGYAVVYLAISLRLGGTLRLFQWMPFGITAILAAIGAQMAH
jgi:hypothetical protein